MSGIVGIVNRRGVPVDRPLLSRLTRSLAYRGPDGQQVWAEDCAGLGHALLQTTDEVESSSQPLTRDRQTWITADARLDDAETLRRQLRDHGQPVAATAGDAELLLAAYQAWGERCVEHLLGDFAFAIWDGRAQRLFCARDPFGVKPFYYAESTEGIVFGNTLACVRAHPDVDPALNEQTLGDVLLFGHNRRLETTAFADIQRLPPAHVLIWRDGHLTLRRWWSLPVEEPLRLRDPRDYLAGYRDVLRTAVADRLRTQRAAIFVTGGMDSGAVAALARDVFVARGRPFALRGYTAVFDQLFPDSERHYSRLTAEALDIPIQHLEGHDWDPYQDWGEPGVASLDPIDDPGCVFSQALYQEVASQARVALTGQGGDALLAWTRDYFPRLVRSGRLLRWLREAGGYLWTHWRFPPLGIRSGWRIFWGGESGPFPCWLDPRFVAEWSLRERWQEARREPPPVHPTHNAAYHYLQAPGWVWMFERNDPGTTGVALESFHPYFDLRVVRYVLRIPPVPWCLDKEIARRALEGLLPPAVLARPKTPLGGDPCAARVRQLGRCLSDYLRTDSGLERFVNLERLRQVLDCPEALARAPVGTPLYAVSLGHWLALFSRLSSLCLQGEPR